MRIRIEFDVLPSGYAYDAKIVNEQMGEGTNTLPRIYSSRRFRTFVEIPDMLAITEVKAEKVEEVKP